MRFQRWLCGLVSVLLASSSFASGTSQSSHQKHPLVENGRNYLGIRYRYGGSSPSRGFDCSGFVYYLLSRHGIRAPHSAAALFRMGKPISKSDLKPGDLVFFKNTARRRGITHVGIYIGNGKFIHASSGRGCVTITSLSDPYYAARFVGARRLPLRKE
ncbi:MAG: C40 family peptidase [Armatimonadetes bacterium]|nr:C40 family peptidase [Armatimonadota bacterium]